MRLTQSSDVGLEACMVLRLVEIGAPLLRRQHGVEGIGIEIDELDRVASAGQPIDGGVTQRGDFG